MKKIFNALLLITATSTLAFSADAPVTIQDDFSAKSDRWAGGGKIEDGVLKVKVETDGKYHGQQILLKPSLALPDDETKFLHIQFKIVSMDVIPTTAGDTETHGADIRMFLAPGKLPDFLEPYALPNCIILVCYYNPKEGVSYSLFNKKDQKEGFGALLYSGKISKPTFPLKVDLYVNPKIYRVAFDGGVVTDKGSLSGKLDLAEDTWFQTEGVHWGARVLNTTLGGTAQASFDDVKVETVSFP